MRATYKVLYQELGDVPVRSDIVFSDVLRDVFVEVFFKFGKFGHGGVVVGFLKVGKSRVKKS